MNGNSEVQLYIIIALLTLTQHIENRNKTKEHFPKTDKLIKKRETNKMNEQNPKVKRQNPAFSYLSEELESEMITKTLLEMVLLIIESSDSKEDAIQKIKNLSIMKQ